MARRGRGAAGAGHRRDRLLRRRHHRDRRRWSLLAPLVVEFAISFGPADYFALIVVAFTTVSAVLGGSFVRGLSALGLGLAVGLVGIDSQTGQARYTLGVPQLLDGIDIVVIAVGLFAVGEALWVASRMRHGAADVIPVGQGVDGPRRLVALVAAVAARLAARLPARDRCRRAAPRSRRSCRTASRSGCPSTARSSGTVRSRASPGRRRPTTPPPPARSCRCWRSACRRPRPPRSCWPPSSSTGCSPGRCCSRRARAGVGPDREPVHRQHDAAGAEPAAGAGCGPGCCTCPGPSCTPASCCSPRSASTRSTAPRSTW